jgi:hypothetical protein
MENRRERTLEKQEEAATSTFIKDGWRGRGEDDE